MGFDVNIIDVVGERKDGAIELFIFSEGKEEMSEEQQSFLLDKIENYITYLNSSKFVEEFPNVSKDKKYIIIKYREKPSDNLLAWLHEIKTWVESNDIIFEIVYS